MKEGVFMKVDVLRSERIEDFKKYCRKHRKEIDDSFLYEEDLRDFELGNENPTYIITDEQDEIVAAASLILNDHSKNGKKARFRIFHSEINDIENYNMMLQAILRHTEGLNNVFVFMPLANKELINLVETLKFNVERYSFFLIRKDLGVSEPNLPTDYQIRPFQSGMDEKTWCDIRNICFRNLKGSEVPITPEMVEKIASGESIIEGGMMILQHKDRPVGIVMGARDDEGDNLPMMNIGPLAIIPEYQGKGLGRSLLRIALQFAKEKGYSRTCLCVNAENERAKFLYLDEGFKEEEAVVCYKYDLA